MTINMSIDAAMRSITAFVSLLLGRKVQVIWGDAAQCGPDGVLHLPRPKVGSPEEVAYLTRLAMHECGHYEETDFAAIAGLSQAELFVFNALEDPRMESRQVSKYPGASVILNRGLEEAFKVILENINCDDPTQVGKLTLINLIIRGYAKVAPHEAVIATGGEIVEVTDKVISDKNRAAIAVAIEELAQCQDSADAAAVAVKLCASFREPEPKSEAGDENEQPDGCEESQPPEGGDTTHGDSPNDQGDAQAPSPNNEGTGSGQPEPNPTEEPSSGDRSDGERTEDATQDPAGAESASADQSGPNELEGTGGASTGMHGENTVQSSGEKPVDLDLAASEPVDLGNLIQQAYEAQFGAMDINSPESMEMDPQDDTVQAVGKALETVDPNDSLEKVMQAVSSVLMQDPSEESASEDEESTDQAASAAPTEGGKQGRSSERTFSERNPQISLTGVVGKLVRVFLREMQDKRRRPVKLADSGGRVAANRVWRLRAVGDTKVFRVQQKVAGIDAAVTVLLDRSQSMEDDIKEAVQAALACSQALERISKVRTSIEMFPGAEISPGRYLPTMTLQRFGQTARQVASRAADVTADGGTPLLQALETASVALGAQRCEKRLIVLITDGMPYNRPACVREIASLESAGIDVVGIGMGSSCQIELLTPNSVQIDSVAGLPDALEKLFSGQMLQRMAA